MRVVSEVRIDKWLWAVRLYRTRSLAARACAGGKVTILGSRIKPARSVRIGEVVAAATGSLNRTVKVTLLIDQRVPASEATQCYEDLTPASEFTKAREANFTPISLRPAGAGRPTKRERRKLQQAGMLPRDGQ